MELLEKAKKYIDIKKFIKLILIFLLFYYSYLFKKIPIFLFNIDKNNISNSERILLMVFAEICNLIILLIIYRKDLIKYVKKMKKNFLKTIDNSFGYYVIGLIGMMVTNILLNILFNGTGAENEKIVQNLINTSPLIMLIDAGIIAPIVEELTFRKTFMDTFKTKWLFILTSGIFFGLLHISENTNNLVDFLYFIPYASLGISFAYMDYKEKSVIPSVIMHMMHNTILILLSILF